MDELVEVFLIIGASMSEPPSCVVKGGSCYTCIYMLYLYV